jgi:WD40 repeat protein
VRFDDRHDVITPSLVDLKFAPDGRAWATDEDRVTVYAPPRWDAAAVFENDADARGRGMSFRALVAGPGRVLVGRRDGRILALDPSGGQLTAQWETGQPVTAIALSDGGRVLVGGEGGAVRMIQPGGARDTVRVDAHRDAVRGIATGPGGLIVTGSADRTVKVWDSELNPVLTLRVGGGVRQLALSDDGRRLTVLVDGERGVRQWRLDVLRREFATLGLDPGPLPLP